MRMRIKHLRLYALLLSFIAIVSVPILGQDGKAVVTAALKAMGAENLKTLELTGSGSSAGIGQNVNPTSGWPSVYVKSYTRQIDLDALASSAQGVRVQNKTDMPFTQVITRDSPWSQQADFWVMPYAFLKGAMANPVTVSAGELNNVKYTVVSYTLQNKYKVEGYIDNQSLVADVRTWIDNDVLGDMLVEATYINYKDFGGVKVPTAMVVRQGGFPTLTVLVSGAKPNVPVAIPAAPAAAPAPATTVVAERIAEGVYYLKGGTHHSVLVEFANHLTLIEAPLSEQRSQALLAEIKKLYPNKPLTEVVNTHHHFDHSGGLRTFANAGVTIITDEINKDFYETAFATPRTLNPDIQQEQGKTNADIVTVKDKKVLTDATRTLELYRIKDNTHDDGILMAFLPKEKILVEADLYNPPAPNAPAPAANAKANAAIMLKDLETLHLDFETILPLHGPGKVTRADLYAFAGKPFIPFSELPVPAPPASKNEGALSDAQMQTLLVDSCGSCHSVDRVTQKKANKEEWTNTVNRMVSHGASLTDEQLPLIIDYLTRTHGE
jgi:glyoxylase-like metal-dependent hydrolase (beta-lactamase superfamily II)